ncbi:hypothetical protein EG830_09110 [bacterium]|nr:hypothetical protein [bacterium]
MSNEESTLNQSQPQTSMSTNLPNLSKYMDFLGLLAMIGGVIYCLTIIGAIIGVPYFIMGKRLRESADAFNGYSTSSSARDLETAIEKQTRAFFILYILTIIGLVLLAIYLVVIIGLLVSGAF